MTPDPAQFRDRSHYLAAVVSELAAPALKRYASSQARGPITPPREWRNGVILGSGHIGDVLYRTCSLGQLARGLPSCQWSYLTTCEGAEILRNNPAISAVLPFNRETAVDFVSPYSIRDLRARNFDVVLCTDNIQHQRALWLATKLGIPNRVAFVQKGFSGLATIPVRTGRASWPEQIRAMVTTVTGTPTSSPLRPRIYLADEDRDAARTQWERLSYPDASLTIAASVTTRQQLGGDPRSLFVAILRTVLVQSPGARIILNGTSGDGAVLRSIAEEVGPRSIVLAGALKLRGFAAFLALCDAFVGADSGPRHLANAASIPVFFVRNLGVPEIEAGRYCETETDIAPQGEYLSSVEAMRALEAIDHRAVASAVITAATRHRAELLPSR